MSTDTATPSVRPSSSPRRATRVTVLTALVATVGNILLRLVAEAAGADFVVTRPDGAVFTVAVGAVALMTIVPVALGGVALAIGQRWRRGPSAIAWSGLALGVLTLPMPLTAGAGTGTATVLALMHLVTGGVWFVAVRRELDGWAPPGGAPDTVRP